MNISRKYLTWFLLAILVMAMAAPAFAQSDTIVLETGIFISAINQWLGMALGIIAIGVGIAGAFALANYVGRMIVGALNGRMGGQ